MEALTRQPLASPALHQLTLSIFGTTDLWGGDPARDALTRLVETAREEDVRLIPASLGAILPLLASARGRFEIALDAVLRFDLHEAAEGLGVLVWQGDADAVLAASAVAAHPAAPPTFRDLVSAHAADLPAHWQQDLYHARLNRQYVPRSDASRWDRLVRWLPDDVRSSHFAAAALEPPTTELTPRDHFRLLIDLVAQGVVVRRLPTAIVEEGPWLPSWVPRIGPGSRQPGFRVTSPLRSLDRQRVVERVFRLVPKATRVRRPSIDKGAFALPELSMIEVFDDGALPRPEVAYLAGVSKSQFDVFRRYSNLQPLRFRGANYWTFSQVVGLRAAQYLFRAAGRRVGVAAVADRLVGLARSSREVPVAITLTGEVLVKEDEYLYNVESGQLVHEDVVSLVDEIYEPFVLGGSAVPRLLRPAPQVAVHPAVVRGLPCVSGTRVTVDAVSKALASARAAGNDEPVTFVAEAYDLDPRQVTDAQKVANDVKAAL